MSDRTISFYVVKKKSFQLMSTVPNLGEGSYPHAKLSLYKVYDYFYLQVQASPRWRTREAPHVHYSRELFIFLIHLPIIMHSNRRAHYLHLPCAPAQPVRHGRALSYELTHTDPYNLMCPGSRHQPCFKIFDCRCACATVCKKLSHLSQRVSF